MSNRPRVVDDRASLAARMANWREFLELCKPRVVLLIAFTALVGMFLATPSLVPWQTLVFGTLGIGLASAAAAAINHVVDQRIDLLMPRTRTRPLPTGRLDPGTALLFAAVLLAIAMAVLIGLVNRLTAALTLASFLGYSVLYTRYLKWATPQNIVLGGAAGAMPPVLGWAAVTNELHPHALLLFLIIFAWTPPHFWALAIHRRAEYARAGIPMLPVTHGVAFTKQQILLYTGILFAVSLLPFATGMSGLLYMLGAVALGAGFLYYAVALLVTADDRLPIKTFGYSIVYLTGLFACLLLDHYITFD